MKDQNAYDLPLIYRLSKWLGLALPKVGKSFHEYVRRGQITLNQIDVTQFRTKEYNCYVKEKLLKLIYNTIN